jgi:hypothetical protein
MAGIREIKLHDVSADAIQIMIYAAAVGSAFKDVCSHSRLLRDMNASLLTEVIRFTSSVHMAWIGTDCAKAKVDGCKDPEVFVAILSCSPTHFTAEEEEEWAKVEGIAAKNLANLVLEQDSAWCAFPSSFPMEALATVIDSIEDSEWSDVDTFVFAANSGTVAGHTVQRGAHVQIQQTHGSATVYVQFNDDFAHAMRVCDVTCIICNIEEGGAATDRPDGSSPESTIFVPRFGTMLVGRSFAYRLPERSAAVEAPGHRAGAHTLSFRFQLSKLHRQCLALSRFFAYATQQDIHDASMEEAYRYYSQRGCPHMANILLEGMAVCFSSACANYACRLTCAELEDVIAHPQLRTRNQDEMSVVVTAIDWAMHKAKSPWRVGDELRVKQTCARADWRGSDAVLRAITLCKSQILVERSVMRDVTDLDRNCSVCTAVKECATISREHVCGPDETGLIRLLTKIRTAYIPMEHLRTRLSPEQHAYASRHACFQQLVQEVVSLRTGKLRLKAVGGRGVPRTAYAPLQVEKRLVGCISRLILHCSVPEHLAPNWGAMPERLAPMCGGMQDTSQSHCGWSESESAASSDKVPVEAVKQVLMSKLARASSTEEALELLDMLQEVRTELISMIREHKRHEKARRAATQENGAQATEDALVSSTLRAREEVECASANVSVSLHSRPSACSVSGGSSDEGDNAVSDCSRGLELYGFSDSMNGCARNGHDNGSRGHRGGCDETNCNGRMRTDADNGCSNGSTSYSARDIGRDLDRSNAVAVPAQAVSSTEAKSANCEPFTELTNGNTCPFPAFGSRQEESSGVCRVPVALKRATQQQERECLGYKRRRRELVRG